MKHLLSTALFLGMLVGQAQAQTPVFIDFPGGYRIHHVTRIGDEVVATGFKTNGGTAFRWSSLTGETDLGVASSNGNVRGSADGTRVSATIPGVLDGINRASIWDGVSWTAVPGLGGVSGTSESTAYGLSGDGQFVVGLAWINAGAAHAFRWSQTGGTQDMGGFFSDPSSRANDVNGDGSVVVGWKNTLGGSRRGARWVNGVLQPQFSWVDPSNTSFILGEAYGTNAAGTTIVGGTVYGGPNSAWRWDASTGLTRLLPNLPGQATTADAFDVTDDGQVVVGHAGGNVSFGSRAIRWVNDQPQDLFDELVVAGTQGLGAYTSLGIAFTMSDDGSVIGGFGAPLAGEPSGWIVVLTPTASVPFCSGDGTATPCPCGNTGAPGRGCDNGSGFGGAKLSSSGSLSISVGGLVLHGEGAQPGQPGLYFQGDNAINGGQGVLNGDGLRCAGGNIRRLQVRQTDVNGDSFTTVDIPALGLVNAGEVKRYQLWYRTPGVGLCGTGFNLSNGLELSYAP